MESMGQFRAAAWKQTSSRQAAQVPACPPPRKDDVLEAAAAGREPGKAVVEKVQPQFEAEKDTPEKDTGCSAVVAALDPTWNFSRV
ncbi:hypothetical protein E5288_WYG007595 [Bos mutus]|uniref:Uncharacterized protein n=1 Tax=Bos mutus TaxID=72004 RepID=A0A6B0REI8_9CETA|nr:hypothetical protein [Bos mutus]